MGTRLSRVTSSRSTRRAWGKKARTAIRNHMKKMRSVESIDLGRRLLDRTLKDLGSSLRKLGKAGASRWRGRRPTVRGAAMNQPQQRDDRGGECFLIWPALDVREGELVADLERQVAEQDPYPADRLRADVVGVVTQTGDLLAIGAAVRQSQLGIELLVTDDQARAEELASYINSVAPDAIAFGRTFDLGPSKPGKIEARLVGPDTNVLRELEQQALEIFKADADAKGSRGRWYERVKVIRPRLSEEQADAVDLIETGRGRRRVDRPGRRARREVFGSMA